MAKKAGLYKRFNTWFDRQSSVIQVTFLILFVFVMRTWVFGLYTVPTESMETTMLVGERFVADKFSPLITSVKRGDIISFNDPNFNYSENTLMNIWQRYVWGPSNWTKRVIGLPGERVTGRIEGGIPTVYINGEKLDEPYKNQYPIIAVHDGVVSTQSEELFKYADVHYKSFDPDKPLWNQPFYTINSDKVVKELESLTVRQPNTPLSYQHDTFDVQLGEHEYWAMGDNRLASYDSRGWGPLDKKHIHGKIRFCFFSLDGFSSWLIWDIIRHPVKFWSQVRWNRCLKFIK